MVEKFLGAVLALLLCAFLAVIGVVIWQLVHAGPSVSVTCRHGQTLHWQSLGRDADGYATKYWCTSP